MFFNYHITSRGQELEKKQDCLVMFYNMYQIINSIYVYKHLCDCGEGGVKGMYETFLQGL